MVTSVNEAPSEVKIILKPTSSNMSPGHQHFNANNHASISLLLGDNVANILLSVLQDRKQPDSVRHDPSASTAKQRRGKGVSHEVQKKNIGSKEIVAHLFNFPSRPLLVCQKRPITFFEPV
jgi:hypothetical protein